MMMILSPIGLIKSAGFESDFHYYDVTDLLFMVIPYFSHGSKQKPDAKARKENTPKHATHGREQVCQTNAHPE